MKKPWLTYKAIKWLNNLDVSFARVFEYGSGESTEYWLDRGLANYRAVEDDEEWYEKLSPRAKAVTILEKDSRKYVKSIAGHYDLVIVDGSHRSTCTHNALQYGPSILILDNSDWFPFSCARIIAYGYIELRFTGFGPCNWYRWTTSVFIKTPHIYGKMLPYKERQVLFGIKQQLE
jgi:hypothetical protein